MRRRDLAAPRAGGERRALAPTGASRPSRPLPSSSIATRSRTSPGATSPSTAGAGSACAVSYPTFRRTSGCAPAWAGCPRRGPREEPEPHALDRDLDRRRDRRGGRLGGRRARARRDDLGGLAGVRRARLLRDRVPLLRPLHRLQGAGRRQPAGHAGRAARQRRRLPADRPARAVRPPLRGDRRRRPAGRPGAGRADGLPAGHDLDHRRRHLRRRGAGHGDPVLLDAPRRQEPRADGARRDRPGRRRRPRWSRCSRS